MPTYDTKTDIWAVGCILYELSVGCKAFEKDEAVLIYKVGQIQLKIPEMKLSSGQTYAPRILLAEDDPGMRDLLSRVLAEDGYSVTSVGTGRQALDAARGNSPDAIVVDLSLPDTDGTEVINEIRTEFAWVNALAISGYVSAGLPTSVAFLQKPFRPQEFRLAVYKLLDATEKWKPISKLSASVGR